MCKNKKCKAVTAACKTAGKRVAACRGTPGSQNQGPFTDACFAAGVKTVLTMMLGLFRLMQWQNEPPTIGTHTMH
jgi:hypothetical protein